MPLDLDKFYAERTKRAEKLAFKYKDGSVVWARVYGDLKPVKIDHRDIEGTARSYPTKYYTIYDDEAGFMTAPEHELFPSKEAAERAEFKKKLAKESKTMDKELQRILNLAGLKAPIMENDSFDSSQVANEILTKLNNDPKMQKYVMASPEPFRAMAHYAGFDYLDNGSPEWFDLMDSLEALDSLAEQNENGVDSPFTYGDENVAMVRGAKEVDESNLVLPLKNKSMDYCAMCNCEHPIGEHPADETEQDRYDDEVDEAVADHDPILKNKVIEIVSQWADADMNAREIRMLASDAFDDLGLEYDESVVRAVLADMGRVDEADVDEDFLAPKNVQSGQYDDVAQSAMTEVDPNAGEHDCAVDHGKGYCDVCGAWVDPAGGVHAADEENPAKMYEIAPIVGAVAGAAVRGAAAAVGGALANKITGVEEAGKKKAPKPVAKDDDADDLDDKSERIVDVGDDEDNDNFDFESEFDKTMGTTRGMFEDDTVGGENPYAKWEQELGMEPGEILRKKERLAKSRADNFNVSTRRTSRSRYSPEKTRSPFSVSFEGVETDADKASQVYEMNELRRLAGLAEQSNTDWDKEISDLGQRMKDSEQDETFASKLSRSGAEMPTEPVIENDGESVEREMKSFSFDNERAYYLAADFLGDDMDLTARDVILVPEEKADKMCDLLLSHGFEHGRDFTDLEAEWMEEDLQNGYNDHHMVDGEDLFPKGATSQPAGDLGPAGAKHGDNPMSTRMKTAEDKIYEGYKLAYRKFRKG